MITVLLVQGLQCDPALDRLNLLTTPNLFLKISLKQKRTSNYFTAINNAIVAQLVPDAEINWLSSCGKALNKGHAYNRMCNMACNSMASFLNRFSKLLRAAGINIQSTNTADSYQTQRFFEFIVFLIKYKKIYILLIY